MLEILQFTFSSFWVFSGCVIFLAVIIGGVVGFVEAIRK